MDTDLNIVNLDISNLPPPEFLIYCSISKRFCLHSNSFDLLNKMRYILWVVALLEACDVINNGRLLGFYQELDISLKPREMVTFWFLKWKITLEYTLCMILATRFTFIVDRSWKKREFSFKTKWLNHLLRIKSHLVTTETDHHWTFLEMREKDKRTAAENVRCWCFIL